MSTRKWSKKNLPELKKIMKEFTEDTRPSIAGLIRKLKLTTYNQFYVYLNMKDEIGEIFKDAYMYLVEFHERRLCDPKSSVNSIFVLKCLKKLGVSYKEYDTDLPEDNGNGNKLTIEVVTKDRKAEKEVEDEDE